MARTSLNDLHRAAAGQEPTPQPVPLAAGRLLGWIQNSWKEPIIRMREIQLYGPQPHPEIERARSKRPKFWSGAAGSSPCQAAPGDTKMWRIAIGD